MSPSIRTRSHVTAAHRPWEVQREGPQKKETNILSLLEHLFEDPINSEDETNLICLIEQTPPELVAVLQKAQTD